MSPRYEGKPTALLWGVQSGNDIFNNRSNLRSGALWRRVGANGLLTAAGAGVGGSITVAAGRQGLNLGWWTQRGLNAYGGLGGLFGSFSRYDGIRR